MRRLELAGELLSGRFFEGLEGPQFLDPSALPLFQSLDEAERRGLVWINALDPAASSLYAPSERRTALPSRLPANRLCVEGGEVLAVSTRFISRAFPEAGTRRFQAPRGPRALRRRSIPRCVAGTENRPRVGERRKRLALSLRPPALRAVGFEEDRGRMVPLVSAFTLLEASSKRH